MSLKSKNAQKTFKSILSRCMNNEFIPHMFMIRTCKDPIKQGVAAPPPDPASFWMHPMIGIVVQNGFNLYFSDLND
jgi:hypothetical protein